MRGKELEGNKESWYEGREVFIGFFSFYLYLKVNAGALGILRPGFVLRHPGHFQNSSRVYGLIRGFL
jgi:hypothetical protein